jgi:late competence protein required for DNA uptake (superfamily II DNA/RNA helicase)
LKAQNSGKKGLKIPVSIWEKSTKDRRPPSTWSTEQEAVLKAIAEGVAVEDANVSAHERMLLVTGKPGCGKTETVCGAAVAAAERGERVLIACPLGALVDVYRQKLPPNENIVVETVNDTASLERQTRYTSRQVACAPSIS